MADQRMQELERAARTGGPDEALAYRMARIRHGLETLPEKTYEVLELHLGALKKKLNSYAKRAVKHGQIPLALHVGEGKRWIERPTPDGRMARLALVRVSVIGDPPTTDEWKFIAALHHTPSGTVIQRAWGVTEADFPEAKLEPYREKDSACDDCGLRRKRNDTYVLQNHADGTVMQVGRTCLQQFLSCSPEAALYQFRTEKDLTDMLAKGRELDDKAKPEWGVPLTTFLMHLLAGIRRRGNFSTYLINPAWRTSLRVGRFLRDNEGNETGELAGYATTEDHHRAQTIREEARAHLKPGADQAQALHNLAVIVAEDTVSERHARLASDLIAWYERRENAILDREREAERLRLADPEYRATEILKALRPHSPNASRRGALIEISADDLARLVLANGDLDSARTRLRELLGDDAPLSKHLGEEGSTGNFHLTVTRLKDYADRRRGGRAMTLVEMEDEHGRKAIWYAYREKATDLSTGQTLSLRAKIYRCGTSRFSGAPETTLQYVERQATACAG